MISKIVQAALILTFVIFATSTAQAQTTTNTDCTATSTGTNSANVNCTSTSNTPPSAADNAAAMAQAQKNGEEMGHAIGAPIGLLIARKRAEHQQEKNDLVAVVYCRQNPTGNWTFPNKAPTPCATLGKNVVAYCTVNPKTGFCKDVAKLPAAPPPAEAVKSRSYGILPDISSRNSAYDTPRAPAPVAAIAPTPQVQPQPPQALVTQPQPVQNVIVSQPQVQTDVSATLEVSVAEAARRNKAAKEAEKASSTVALTQATNNAGTSVTYTGVIPGGASNGLVGHSVVVTGFANIGNNGSFVITGSTATTLVAASTTAVNETHAATAQTVANAPEMQL
jgi:hypothetical protein